MTLDQRERERIQLLSTLFVIPGSLIGFILPILYLTDPTAGKIAQFQVLVIIIAVFGIVPYILLSKYGREHSEHIPEQSKGIIESLKLAFKNKSFVIYIIYDGVSVFTLNSLLTTLPFFLIWVLAPLNPNMLLFWIPPLTCLIISIPLILRIADNFSTKAALSYSLGMLSIGFFVIFFAGLAGNWVFLSVGLCIVMLSFAGDFMLHNPMRADTIDYDYWKVSGERREGLYAGIGPLLSKPMISVALALPTAMMTAFGLIYVENGLDATHGAAAASLGVNLSFALFPGIICLIGFIIWVKFYPLTGDAVKEMKRELQIIHEQKRKTYESKK